MFNVANEFNNVSRYHFGCSGGKEHVTWVWIDRNGSLVR